MFLDEAPEAVLFCCTMNSIRSPMAENMLKHLWGTKIFVQSAGVREGQVDGFAIQAMQEIGIDISRHHTRLFEDLEDSSFDLIVALSPEAQHHAVEMTRTMACEVEFWNTFDPSILEGTRDVRLDGFRAVRDQIYTRIKKRFPPDIFD